MEQSEEPFSFPVFGGPLDGEVLTQDQIHARWRYNNPDGPVNGGAWGGWYYKGTIALRNSLTVVWHFRSTTVPKARPEFGLDFGSDFDPY